MTSNIHPTAIVDKEAVVGEGTSIGAYSIVGPQVVLGRNNWIGPHVVLEGNTAIGDENRFFQFSSIGSVPQDLKYRGEDSRLTIGDRNTIREYVTIQPGTEGGGMLTSVGHQNLFMVMSHLGHDGHVGNGNVFANSVAISGHVVIGNDVILGGLCGIHQFVRIGDNAILGAGSMVSMDIPPFCIGQGDRCSLIGINKIGLERKGATSEEIALLRKLFREIILTSGKLVEKIAAARPQYAHSPRATQFLDFITLSERGVTAPRRSSRKDSSDDSATA